MFGKIKDYSDNENGVEIQFEKIKAKVIVINPSIINFFVPIKGKEYKSKAIENLKIEKCNYRIKRDREKIVLSTEKIKVYIFDDFKVDIYDVNGNMLCADYRKNREPFLRRGVTQGCDLAVKEGHKINVESNKYKINVVKKMESNMFFYGLGEKTGPLNKKGYRYKMWNTDNPSAHTEAFEALYKSIPFFITLRKGQSFGIFFDNTFETCFDMGKENSEYYYFGAVDGNIDYYFIYGPEVKEVVNRFTYLTGKTPLPQIWTLGYQQSRWTYVPESRLISVAESFRKKNIPCDVLYLDIDYMDGYKVFTFDKDKFHNPKETMDKLKKMGFKVVTIIDPGVKKDRGYKIYDEGIKNDYFIKNKDGIPYVNEVWPGDALYPDFSNEKVRKWWADNQKIMIDYGVSGIWNDMNEPASFNGPLPEDVMFNNEGTRSQHKEIHNVYGHLMSKATNEGIKKYTGKRPFVITRACYAGTQKYSTVWTGDNKSIWQHLRMSIPMLMNLGLSGISFCGTDVGGFGEDCSAELLSRWVQVGCFTPLFRNHSSIFTRDQEPWAFDEKTEDINKKYIKLRYKFIPYLYDLFFKGEKTGLPIICSLMLYYENDENTYEINDEFLCGENILVSPVVEQGKTRKLVYLPKGNDWIDYWTKETLKGGQYIIKKAPLDVCPIYIKSGSIIPNYPEQNYIGEKEINELAFDIYIGEKERCSYINYEDDGESFDYKKGIYNMYKINVKRNIDKLNLDIEMCKNSYKKGYLGFNFKINNIGNVKKVLADGKNVQFKINNDVLQFYTAKSENIEIYY
ncbi:MAG: glycoside hydrolase family 31 protein [Clostridium sp.]|nr:glycoside hydrolase family 31 protein [Clostridium sp.]